MTASDFDDVSTAARGQPGSGRSYALVVVQGNDQGRVFQVDDAQPSRLLLGQSPACEIRLSDPEVSRRHAAIDIQNGRLRIVDLESTNGTFVDGVSVIGAHPREGETIRVGSTVLRVECTETPFAGRVSTATHFGRVMGVSVEMRRLYPLCERLAASQVPVIIEGETGTGKEGLAEALHETGPRASAPFVVFDCTAVPPSLVESELFGHERGAFTGATGMRKGMFEEAHGGTLLIDEIGDLDLALQPKLLRAIERSEIRRVGGSQVIRVDVRVLAATRRDLDREIQAGGFRDDLFHRLAVARVELPPLRQRWGDVPYLARLFWTTLGGDDATLPTALFEKWNDYAWPGNVRELRNAVVRQLALGDLASGGAAAHRRTQKEREAEPSPGASPPNDAIARVLARNHALPVARRELLDEFERRYVERVLAEHGGNTAKAAVASGVASFQAIPWKPSRHRRSRKPETSAPQTNRCRRPCPCPRTSHLPNRAL